VGRGWLAGGPLKPFLLEWGERDQAHNVSDYIYAGGKRIAKALAYEGRIQISGTNCGSCGPQSTLFTFSGLNWLPYVVQNGDRLFIRMKEDAGSGGMVLGSVTEAAHAAAWPTAAEFF
jgi:hypothetical protein